MATEKIVRHAGCCPARGDGIDEPGGCTCGALTEEEREETERLNIRERARTWKGISAAERAARARLCQGCAKGLPLYSGRGHCSENGGGDVHMEYVAGFLHFGPQMRGGCQAEPALRLAHLLGVDLAELVAVES